MAHMISAIRIAAKQEENCMGRTCLKWRRNGELNEHDVALILQRLREVDPEACEIQDALSTPQTTVDR